MTMEEIELIEDDRERYYQLVLYWKKINIKTATDLIVDDFESRICGSCELWVLSTANQDVGRCETGIFCTKDIPNHFGCNRWRSK